MLKLCDGLEYTLWLCSRGVVFHGGSGVYAPSHLKKCTELNPRDAWLVIPSVFSVQRGKESPYLLVQGRVGEVGREHMGKGDKLSVLGVLQRGVEERGRYVDSFGLLRTTKCTNGGGGLLTFTPISFNDT